MGEGVRNQIWKYLDDPEFQGHESLRNALYRLLVAVEIPGTLTPSFLDAMGCLDVAAEAVREKNAAVIARACRRMDDLVEHLAAQLAAV